MNTESHVMKPGSLRVWAIALIIAGVSFSSFMFFHPANTPTGALNPLWTPVHFAWFSAYLLILGSFVPLYGLLENHQNSLTTVGYGVSFLGTALSLPISIWDSCIVPYLARHAPAMILDIEEVSLETPVLMFRGLFFLTVLLFSSGFMVFGIAGGRSQFFSWLTGICLAIGAPLFWLGAIGFSQSSLGNSITTLGAVLFGLGLIQLGATLWEPMRVSSKEGSYL